MSHLLLSSFMSSINYPSVDISRSLTLCLAPDPGPQFVFAGPGLQFVAIGSGIKFVVTGSVRGLSLHIPTLAPQ